MATEMKLIQSDSVAYRVINALGLAKRQDLWDRRRGTQR